MKPNIFEALEGLQRGKRMSREMVKEIIEAALLSAARKALGISPERVIVTVGEDGSLNVSIKRLVVEGRPATPDELGLAEARKLKAGTSVGEEVETKVPLDDLGRIAAQTAKHIVLQRVRETERESLFSEFSGKIGKAVTSIVKQRRGKLVILDLGDAEAVLPGNEQIPKEDYRPGEHFKVYVVEVNMTPRGPHILASRNRPELVRILFEHEVPEIAQGIVEIKAVAREPGSRTKVAVFSHDRNIDPVGACIGMKGMRVQAVVQELHGEKMDVISWDENPEAFLINALSPAKPMRVERDDGNHVMTAVAADKNQLQHLIGRGGQNARLASKLTSWRVEVMTDGETKGEEIPVGDGVPAEGQATLTPAETPPGTAAPEASVPPAGEASAPPPEDPSTIAGGVSARGPEAEQGSAPGAGATEPGNPTDGGHESGA